ncbi:hypothetical protein D3C76_1220560 [compost metagenome]
MVALGDFCIDIGIGTDDAYCIGQLPTELHIQTLTAGLAGSDAIAVGIGGQHVLFVDMK